jgi:hypothetical protein
MACSREDPTRRANVAMLDGPIRLVEDSISQAAWRGPGKRAGGVVIGGDAH